MARKQVYSIKRVIKRDELEDRIKKSWKRSTSFKAIIFHSPSLFRWEYWGSIWKSLHICSDGLRMVKTVERGRIWKFNSSIWRRRTWQTITGTTETFRSIPQGSWSNYLERSQKIYQNRIRSGIFGYAHLEDITREKFALWKTFCQGYSTTR